MLINCFRPASGKAISGTDDDRPQAVRPSLASTPRKSSRFVKRQSSGGSRLSNASSKSTQSNESISKLPPCKRESDAKIESMMMPLPPCEHRSSRCLRMSYPKTYSNIVSDMKKAKGCRDWRNFDVFYSDEVDENLTADEAARRRAVAYQRQLRQLNNSFQWSEGSSRSTEQDLIP